VFRALAHTSLRVAAALAARASTYETPVAAEIYSQLNANRLQIDKLHCVGFIIRSETSDCTATHLVTIPQLQGQISTISGAIMDSLDLLDRFEVG
jgi:hypothetical protein